VGTAVVRSLHPGYFALVMATGIVSVGLRDHGLDRPSTGLLWLAAGAYAVFAAATAGRVVAYRTEVRRDLADPARGFGMFTFVAGSDVLGVRLAMEGHTAVAAGLLTVGVAAWSLLGWLVPVTVVRRGPRPLLAGANGTWFIWVVAVQSVAVLATTLDPVAGAAGGALAVVAVGFWSVGAVCYLVVATLVGLRLVRHRLRPVDLTPPYWVAMGATAITVLAGTGIATAGRPALAGVREVAAAISLAYWVLGTVLIPPLLAAWWWRHVTHRVPLRYEPTWWSIVFPLGMYGVATRRLGEVADLPLVAATGRYELWLAAAAWTAAFAAMLGSGWSGAAGRGLSRAVAGLAVSRRAASGSGPGRAAVPGRGRRRAIVPGRGRGRAAEPDLLASPPAAIPPD